MSGRNWLGAGFIKTRARECLLVQFLGQKTPADLSNILMRGSVYAARIC